jgi:sugar-specific transcriptional regulator TrmB
MNMDLREQIKKIGFPENDARVYLALLELGRATVTEIGKATGMNRTTGYDILERLCLNGVANRTTVGKKHMYLAEPPIRLKQYLLNKKNTIENNLEKLENFLPDLRSLYKTDLKPGIKFFEGREGIKNIYADALTAKGTIYSILDAEQYLPEFDQFGKDHAKQRTTLKVKGEYLVRRSKKAQEFWETTYKNKPAKQKITEYRWLDYDFVFSPAAEVMIFDDKVIGVLFKPGENFAFEIQSESFANSLKILFEIVWKQSKPFK